MRADIVRVRIVGCAARDPSDGKVCLIVRAHAPEAQTALVEHAALLLLAQEGAAADVVGIALAVRTVVEVGVVAAAPVLDDGAEEDAVIAAHDLAGESNGEIHAADVDVRTGLVAQARSADCGKGGESARARCLG